MLFSVSGCGGGGSNASRFADTPISQDKPVHEPKSNDIPITPEPSPQSQDKPVEPVPTPTPTPEPIISHEPSHESTRYTVSFNSNSGSTVPSIMVSSGSTIEMPEAPTKAGYVFAGWYKDEAFTEMFIFGTDGYKITGNITLYAQWFDADILIAEYSVGEIAIGYEDGDNPKYVTRNLTLPKKINSADISWLSSSGAVATDGTVTRQAEDINVTLTATATYNGKSAEPKMFELRVIRRRTRDSSAIKALSLDVASSGDIKITRNDSGDATDIEGQYVSFDIRNADDALDAVAVLREELGIRNPDKELQLNGATINEYGAKYSLGQSFNGLKVYGRRIIISTNSENKANFLDSNFLSSDVLTNADLNEGISKSKAEEIAKTNYSDDVECKTKEVIYSFGNYEHSPVRMWIVTISGIQKNGHYTDETIFIKSSDGTILSKSNNIVSMSNNYGVNELNQLVQFPVTFEYSPLEFQGFNYMLDTDLNIEIFYERMPELLFALNRVRLEPNKLWTDGHQVSAYTNMRRVMQLWKQRFSRSSLDGKGMRVKVITHNNYFTNDESTIMKDNAMWSNSREVIVTCDRENEVYAHSYASDLDVLAHESTHAVIHYGIGEEFSMNGNKVADAINEAYADIFACIMTEDENWKMGEDVFDENSSSGCIRDIANPTSENAKDRFTDNWDDLKGALDNSSRIIEEHVFSHYISHAAYLMYKNGISWEELRKLWYQTIHENVYTPFPKFSDVRREVVRAAETIPSLRSKIAVIENAFDEVGIYEPVLLVGKVVDAENYEPIAGVTISALTLSETYGRIADQDETDDNGNFSLRLGKTQYNLDLGTSENGEEPINAVLSIDLSGDRVVVIVLAKDGTASLDVKNPDEPISQPDRINFRHDISKIDAEIDINALTSESSGNGWTFREGTLTLNQNLVYKIKGTSIATTNRITVQSGIDVAVILNTVNIDVSKIDFACAFDTTDAKVELFLKGANSLKSGLCRAGLEVPDSSSLTIYSITNSDADSLIAIGGSSNLGAGAAGIGGPGYYFSDSKGRAGTIIIYSGAINAKGYNGGAGIGGGDTSGSDGGGLIIIYGGNITARADYTNELKGSGAGIGSGYVASGTQGDANDDNTRIFILGGLINAESTGDGAGIGGGYYSNSGIIRILEGLQSSIIAKGGSGAQDIGYGRNGNVSDVKYIDATTIKAMIEDALSAQNNPDKPVNPDVPIISVDILINEEHFPDANFRAYVSNNIDNNKDGILSKTEIENTIKIDVNNTNFMAIASLKGIEYFSALQELSCWNNQLTVLDISQNTALKKLYCHSNLLTALDISKNTALQTLWCNDNQITALDVSKSIELQELCCRNNQLTTLDTSKNTVLQTLYCDYNHLKTLDVSKNTKLQDLECDDNQLTALNVSGCTILYRMDCYNNQLTALNVRDCTALQNLQCYNNQLKTLDVSNCAKNIYVHCDIGVTITWPPSSPYASTSMASNAQYSSLGRTPKILALLPSFTPSTSGTYTFTVSLDCTPPEGSSLILLADSDDLNGSFAFTESPNVVRVSADFTAGRFYAPVIVAETEQQEQSGGCNSGVLGMVLLITVLLRKRRC